MVNALIWRITLRIAGNLQEEKFGERRYIYCRFQDGQGRKSGI